MRWTIVFANRNANSLRRWWRRWRRLRILIAHGFPRLNLSSWGLRPSSSLAVSSTKNAAAIGRGGTTGRDSCPCGRAGSRTFSLPSPRSDAIVGFFSASASITLKCRPPGQVERKCAESTSAAGYIRNRLSATIALHSGSDAPESGVPDVWHSNVS